jgi:hypothetical protein
MSVERIEFSLVQGTDADFPRPYPANREIPDWFKAMPAETDVPNTSAPGARTRTLKNCPPFLEAMTCGYIIPLAADLTLSVDAAGGFHGEAYPANILFLHGPKQVPGAPFVNRHVLKILNPWLIQTPPGYSTLFLPLLNRFQLPLHPLAGLVETDVFYREVNFPTILTMPPGTTLKLARGTPLVQAIPIRRDEFQSEFVPLKVEKFNEMNEKTRDLPENYNFYKDNYWRKKGYH